MDQQQIINQRYVDNVPNGMRPNQYRRILHHIDGATVPLFDGIYNQYVQQVLRTLADTPYPPRPYILNRLPIAHMVTDTFLLTLDTLADFQRRATNDPNNPQVTQTLTDIRNTYNDGLTVIRNILNTPANQPLNRAPVAKYVYEWWFDGGYLDLTYNINDAIVRLLTGYNAGLPQQAQQGGSTDYYKKYMKYKNKYMNLKKEK